MSDKRYPLSSLLYLGNQILLKYLCLLGSCGDFDAASFGELRTDLLASGLKSGLFPVVLRFLGGLNVPSRRLGASVPGLPLREVALPAVGILLGGEELEASTRMSLGSASMLTLGSLVLLARLPEEDTLSNGPASPKLKCIY